MTATATLTAPAPVTSDHEVSVATAAQTLAVRPATVRRYLTAGKLTRLGNAISADSVEAYRVKRDAGRAKFAACRFRKIDLKALSDVELAAEAWAEAQRLEALARDLKAKARKTLEEAGAGTHGIYEVRFTAGRTMQDNDAIRAHYKEIGEEVPTKKAAPSIKVHRIAA